LLAATVDVRVASLIARIGCRKSQVEAALKALSTRSVPEAPLELPE
jgi:hypothetical protein